jgi:hypothetical protein
VAAFKVAALSIDLAGLGVAVVGAPDDFAGAGFNPLGPATGPLSWIVRQLAEAGGMAAWGLTIEALSRIHGRLTELNGRHAEGGFDV